MLGALVLNKVFVPAMARRGVGHGRHDHVRRRLRRPFSSRRRGRVGHGLRHVQGGVAPPGRLPRTSRTATDGIRAFNVQPGMIDAERILQESGRFGFGGWGAPPEVVGRRRRLARHRPGGRCASWADRRGPVPLPGARAPARVAGAPAQPRRPALRPFGGAAAPPRGAAVGRARTCRYRRDRRRGDNATMSHAAFGQYISADSHVTEPAEAYRDIDPKFRDRAPELSAPAGEGATIVVDPGGPGEAYCPVRPHRRRGPHADRPCRTAGRWDELHPGGYDAAARIEEQTADGFAAEVIFPSVGMVLCGHPERGLQKGLLRRLQPLDPGVVRHGSRPVARHRADGGADSRRGGRGPGRHEGPRPAGSDAPGDPGASRTATIRCTTRCGTRSSTSASRPRSTSSPRARGGAGAARG